MSKTKLINFFRSIFYLTFFAALVSFAFFYLKFGKFGSVAACLAEISQAKEGLQINMKINQCLTMNTDLSKKNMISSGSSHVCVLQDTNIKCWGDNVWGQINVPKDLKRPTQVAAGDRHTCALTYEGVRCWGDNEWGQTNVPKDLKRPTQVAAGDRHTCALTDEGVRCWGNRRCPAGSDRCTSSHGEIRSPTDSCFVPKDLKKAIQISAADSTCALSEAGVRCWGDSEQLQDIAKGLKGPSMVAVREGRQCAVTAEGVRCWGNNNYWGEQNVPKDLKKPTQIALGENHICALTEEGVKCWGYNIDGQTDVPKRLKNPSQLAAGNSYTCALTEEGVRCWGRVNEFPSEWASLNEKKPAKLSKLSSFAERMEYYRIFYTGRWQLKGELDYFSPAPFSSVLEGAVHHGLIIPPPYLPEKDYGLFYDPNFGDPKMGGNHCNYPIISLITAKTPSIKGLKLDIVDTNKVREMLSIADCDELLLGEKLEEFVPNSGDFAEWREFKFNPTIHFEGPEKIFEEKDAAEEAGEKLHANEDEGVDLGPEFFSKVKILTGANSKALLLRSALNIERVTRTYIQRVKYSRPTILPPFERTTLKVNAPGISSMELITTAAVIGDKKLEPSSSLDSVQIPDSEQVGLSKIELWANLGKGPVLVAIGDAEIEAYTWREPDLGVTVLDANSDGNPDFLVRTSNSKYVVLTRDGKVWSLIPIGTLRRSSRAEKEIGGLAP